MPDVDVLCKVRKHPIQDETPGTDCPERFFRGVALGLVLSVPLWTGIGMALHWALA